MLFLTMNKEAKPNILQFFHINKVADRSSGSNSGSQSSKYIDAHNSSWKETPTIKQNRTIKNVPNAAVNITTQQIYV